MRSIALALLLLSPALQAESKKQIAAEVLIQGLQFGAAVADVEGTQHCLKERTCHELNPLMPTGRKAAYGVALSIAGLSSGASLIMHHRHKKMWWFFPIEGAAVHTAGALSGWTK